MVRVSRLNVVLDIEDDSLQKYLNMGYNQVDPETGVIIKESIPSDTGILRVAFVNNKKQIEELTAENEKLKKEIASLKKKKAKAEKAE